MTARTRFTRIDNATLDAVIGGGGEGLDTVQVNGANGAGDSRPKEEDGTPDIITAPGAGGGPHVRVSDTTTVIVFTGLE